jgi:hypothetical protein
MGVSRFGAPVTGPGTLLNTLNSVASPFNWKIGTCVSNARFFRFGL